NSCCICTASGGFTFQFCIISPIFLLNLAHDFYNSENKHAMSVKRICLWSSPRNISTAMMYSFAQRSDTTVVDEPLYAHYLLQSGAAHPGREGTLQSMENDGQKVIEKVILGPCPTPVL